MGNILNKNKYTKLDEYADYAGFSSNRDISFQNFNNDLINIKQMTQSTFNDLHQKYTIIRNKNKELEKIILNQNNIITDIKNKIDSNEIHMNSMSNILDNKFDSYNKDLEALLTNDKLLLNKIQELYPDLIDNNSKINSIKNSYLESNTEYSSFINEK